MPDYHVISNSFIFDGSGGHPFRGDLFFHDDRIDAVVPHGTRSFANCDVLDADGLALAPGFIDSHAHSDLTLLAAPEAFGKISQGITTEVSGNCGQSFFPVTEKNREHLRTLCKNYGVELAWNSFAEYKRLFAEKQPAINYNFLCGHGTLRAAVLGYENHPVQLADIAEMRRLLTDALTDGARGLSTGLLYVPGKFAGREELASVMSVLKDFDAVYATHLRNEGDTILEALDEALFLARQGSGILEVSHLKTAFPRNWGKLDAIFDKIENARHDGLRVTADRYPYTFGQTSLSIILPPPCDSMTDAAIQKLLASDNAEFQRIRAFLAEQSFWDGILLTFSSLEEYAPFLGMSLADIAKKLSRSPAELTADILRRDASRAQGAFGGLSPDNLKRITNRPWVSCGTDENARPADFSLGRSHPRGFGSFPKFLCMAAEQSSLGEAVRRVTSLPAEVFHLRGRGRLAPGFYADFVLFDAEKFREKSDYAHPHEPAEGLAAVYVNGVRAYVPGEPVLRAGRFAD